jgi:MFS family permease
VSTNGTRLTRAQAWVLALTSAASLMVSLDTQVVATALPVIRVQLHASLAELEWTVNAYSLSFAVLLIVRRFFVLSPRTLDLVDGDATVWERTPMERLAAQDELRAFDHEGFWQPMDTLRDRQTLERLWEGGRAPWKIWT